MKLKKPILASIARVYKLSEEDGLMAKNTQPELIELASSVPAVNAVKPIEEPASATRDERIHMVHSSDGEKVACGRPSRGKVTVRQVDQLDQVTCKQCVSNVTESMDSYEASSAKHKKERRKVEDRAVLSALSTDDESPELLGR